MTKKSVQMIIDYFPKLSFILDKNEQLLTKDEIIEKVAASDVEKVFLEMCLFFKDPESNDFNMALVYKHLRDDWLVFAFEVLETFFKEDTYLLATDYTMKISEKDPLLNQTSFAKRLNEEGINIDRRKLNVYLKRGVLPPYDKLIAEKPYWFSSTIDKYIEWKKG